MRRFATLLSVAVEHGYFAGGQARGLDFVADAATAAKLAGRALVARHEGATLLVAGTDEVWDADAALLLRFLAWANAPTFALASEPFLLASDGLLRFSSHRAVEEDDGTWRLHKDVNASRSELRVPDADARAPLLLPARRPLFEVALEATPATAGRRYRIRFAPRKAFWTYYVQGLEATAPFQVVDVDGGETFVRLDAPPPTTAARGLCFRSARPLTVAERAGRRFQLRQRLAAGERTVVRHLPAAGLPLTRVPGRGDAAMQSEIYVNL